LNSRSMRSVIKTIRRREDENLRTADTISIQQRNP